MLFDVDWFSWVMIALMIYFYGKAQYIKSEEDIYSKHKLDYGGDDYYTQELRLKQGEPMGAFWIILVVFIVRETYHLWV